MRTVFFIGIWIACAGPVKAELIDRGGGLIYDSDQDITWMQNANYVVSSGYHPDGKLMWPDAIEWAENLSYYDEVRGVVWDDWRLPATAVPDPACSIQEDRGDDYPLQGKGYGCLGSEMSYLYNFYGVSEENPGPFVGIQKIIYWSKDEFEPDTTRAWWFVFGTGGFQGTFVKPDILTVWAVRDGDVAFDGEELEVEIEVRSGNRAGRVNPASRGKLSLVIFSTDAQSGSVDFDATQVDPLSLRLGNGGAEIAHINGHVIDIDGDGDQDLLTHFPVLGADIACGDSSLMLTGETYAGENFSGEAPIAQPGRSCR